MGAIEIGPQPGSQEKALSSNVDILVFGGAAGGGKSFTLLLEPLRHIGNKDFRAVIFRRTYPQITNPGALWDESGNLYGALGAKSNQTDLSWEFRSGAMIQFAHMQYEKNRHDWQGSQVTLFGFDELTHFTRAQFFYMFSRSRSMSGIRPYIRATCNPVPDDDETGGWIHEFISWYIAEDGYAIPERSGVVRWFIVINDELIWADTPEELREKYADCQPKSFAFVLSTVYDNKKLLAVDPGYLANLKALPLVDRERLLGDPVRGGNWHIKPSAGNIFNRAWFEIVDAVPAGGVTVRFYDLAASEKKFAKDDPDFTASCKMKRVGDIYYILDATEDRLNPAHTDEFILNLASQDGKRVDIRWEMEGGASGKRDSYSIATKLAGYDAHGIPPQGDKLTRAKGLSAQALAGNVKLLRGPWNERWLKHMHGQPDLAHDDSMDAASGAFNELAPPPPKPRTPTVSMRTY